MKGTVGLKTERGEFRNVLHYMVGCSRYPPFEYLQDTSEMSERAAGAPLKNLCVSIHKHFSPIVAPLDLTTDFLLMDYVLLFKILSTHRAMLETELENGKLY